MKLHNEDIRTSCAAELRTVLDSYIGPDMGGAEAVAVMRAMEEASAHILVHMLGMRGVGPVGDIAKTLGAYVCGITNSVASMQHPKTEHQG